MPNDVGQVGEPVIVRCQLEALRDERRLRGREHGQLAVIGRQVLRHAAGQLCRVAQRDADQVVLLAEGLGESCELEVWIGRLPFHIEHAGDVSMECGLVFECCPRKFVAFRDKRAQGVRLRVMPVDDRPRRRGKTIADGFHAAIKRHLDLESGHDYVMPPPCPKQPRLLLPPAPSRVSAAGAPAAGVDQHRVCGLYCGVRRLAISLRGSPVHGWICGQLRMGANALSCACGCRCWDGAAEVGALLVECRYFLEVHRECDIDV